MLFANKVGGELRKAEKCWFDRSVFARLDLFLGILDRQIAGRFARSTI
jgi:hypothetical protein